MGPDYRVQILRLKAENALLRGQLAAAGVDAVASAPSWAAKLAPGAAAFLALLLEAHPQVLDRYAAEERLPARDHVRDRNVKIVDVYASRIRHVWGAGAVEAVRGVGYRLADEVAAELRRAA